MLPYKSWSKPIRSRKSRQNHLRQFVDFQTRTISSFIAASQLTLTINNLTSTTTDTSTTNQTSTMPPMSKEQRVATSLAAKAKIQASAEARRKRAARASTPSSSSQQLQRRTTGTRTNNSARSPTTRAINASNQAAIDQLFADGEEQDRALERLHANVGKMANTQLIHGEILEDHDERLDENEQDIAASKRKHDATDRRMMKLEIVVGLVVVIAAALYLRGPVIESEITRWAESIKSYFE